MTSESESDDNSDPPVRQIFVKGDAGVFSFDGYHLEFQDHRYARNVAQYIPLLEPLPSSTGTTAARQPRHDDSKPHGWWQSQCVFRGLSSDGTTIEELQDVLRGREDDPIADDILDLQERARRKFKAMNKEAREINWLHHMSDEEKAMKDPRRYLKETFPAGSKSKETVLLTTHFVINIQDTARELGLRCEYTHAPTDGDAVLQMAKYWVVVGQDRSIVTEKVRMIERETQRLKREKEEGQQELRRKNKVIKTTQTRTGNEEAIARSKDWDVAGLWSISCPHIEQAWDVGSLTMSLYLETTEKGPQMFAYFDFGVLTGVLRFEKQKGDTKTSSSPRPAVYSNVVDDDEHKSGEDNERDEEPEYAEEHLDDDDDDENSDKSSDTYDEKEDDDDEDDEDRRSPTPEAFYFDTITQPSAKHPTWNFRFRGEETGQGEIEIGSDSELYSITFCSPRGQTLKGVIGSSSFGECTFTGVRVGGDGNEPLDIREEWASRNASAYDDARIGRWH
ncbi:hypothetical protein ONS95_004132 [Cadophora gregata]|uniref:uncharacterized protein n=1 Tax=Cadophora gregata TaxID=51156 RepID=UPI0026DDB71A|nr:uncharacterized protein ONS95_004132 [Cadophora gregata]KAK0105507.1 hypothetical protein ONS96_004893 [Cadophora gregata f. sp. sojae]KAK0105600.1 hypothetical protein ONS95_004132 [Cadophora gregata]